MIRTRLDDDRVGLIAQPDHAALSGFLAARWGGAGSFRRLGEHGEPSDPTRLRAEILFAIAQHDNGWWEWEADPELASDGLPLDLGQSGEDPAADLDRWRRGAARFVDSRPFASLLIASHPFYLYAFAFDELASELDEAFRYPMFDEDDAEAPVEHREATRELLDDLAELRAALERKLRDDPAFGRSLAPPALQPAIRHVQIMDALSLVLCFGAGEPVELTGVPRAGWDDRVTMRLEPTDDGFTMDPWPFLDGSLEASVPMRIARPDEPRGAIAAPVGAPLELLTRRLRPV